MTEPEEKEQNFEDPDSFPDFDEVDSEEIEEDPDCYNETAVDQSYKTDVEQE